MTGWAAWSTNRLPIVRFQLRSELAWRDLIHQSQINDHIDELRSHFQAKEQKYFSTYVVVGLSLNWR